MKNKENILEITQIKIKLSDKKEIELSSEEARKVYEELSKLFKFEKENKTLKEAAEDLKRIIEKQQNSPTYIPYPIYIDKWIKEPYWTYPDPMTPYCGDLPHNYTITVTSPKIGEMTCLSINLTNQT